MARSHGKIHGSIWRDPEWRSLSGDAQRLYLLVLSQPKLSLCGVVDYAPDRWAAYCSDWDTDRLSVALGDLVDTGFVLYDAATGEVAIRTFLRHDFDPNRFNRNLAKGVWSAWEAVESEELRDGIVGAIPEDLYGKLHDFAPHMATHYRGRWNRERRSGSNRTPDPRLEPDPPPRSEPPPPSTSDEAEDEAAAGRGDAAAAETDRDRTIRFHEAVELLVQRTILRKPADTNPAGYEKATRRGKRTDYAEHAMQVLADRPTISTAELADLLEPPVSSLRLVERERCETCNDTTWLDPTEPDDEGDFGPPIPCPDCNQAASA